MKTPHHSVFNLLLIAALLAAVVAGALPALEAQADTPGAWTPTSSLATARYYHMATLLADGRVLVTGGWGWDGLVASAEVYTPSTGQWTSAASMNTIRYAHEATLLADGRVLVTGGTQHQSWEPALSSAEVYDPATGLWTSIGSMHTARVSHTATLLADGRVLVAGGYNNSGILATAELYDPATSQWTNTGSMHAARVNHTATLLADGRVLAVAGGTESSELASAEVYDPVTGQWTDTGSLSIARSVHTATLLLNGRVLVAGGWYGHYTFPTTTEVYDPATGQWTPSGSLNTFRGQHATTMLQDGRVLIAGGWNGTWDPNAAFDSAELYDSLTGQWVYTGSMSNSRFWFTTTVLLDGRVLAVGGSSYGSVFSSAEIYTPSNPVAQLAFNPAQATICDQATVAVDLNDVSNLYGYQFQVTYDPTLVSASGAFVNSFFDTATNATIPAGWDAACAAGVCKFAASKLEPGTPVSGSGPIAQVTFTRLSHGEADVAFSGDILSDRDANPLAHTTNTLHLVACGRATVSGVVALQGRATPIDAGTVTLTDLANAYPPTTVAFDPATGAFTANVPVALGGSSYQIDAGHGLYLANRQIHTLNHDDTYAAPATRLKGGDANNSGLIDIGDLTCIGGSFGGAPVTCGTTGSSDINTDATVNIFDLVLAGGNYDLAAPQPW